MSEFRAPDSTLARIADVVMGAIHELVEAQGGSVDRIFIAITADDMEPDACIAGSGFDNENDLLAYLLMHASQAGERVGLPIQIHPLNMG